MDPEAGAGVCDVGTRCSTKASHFYLADVSTWVYEFTNATLKILWLYRLIRVPHLKLFIGLLHCAKLHLTVRQGRFTGEFVEIYILVRPREVAAAPVANEGKVLIAVQENVRLTFLRCIRRALLAIIRYREERLVAYDNHRREGTDISLV
ncbi:hypothetical protein EVAR_53774_1 [Eumeta japonica]|uniref:Uncharacterized protein n=1 Tax=Eumeta variegata TaxID=151549 RepID=A0A4C1Z152_EUMVA|nr:hypothetical protein EVAR_53774_1 [Eumeta japonica]